MTQFVKVQKIEQDAVIGLLASATQDVLSTMLSTDAAPGSAFVEQTANSSGSGVISLVGMAGTWIGSGGLSCSASLACRLSSQFLMTDYEAVNEEVLDAMAELTNMIIGNVKTGLEEIVGPMGLSVPTVIFGRNFQTRNAGNHEWMILPFDCDGELLMVQICLMPCPDGNERTTRPAFPIPHMVTA